MRLLPRPGLVVLGRGRFVRDEMYPGMPLGWDLRGLGEILIDDPAARAFPLLVVDVAKGILADALALAPGIKARTQRVAVPPGEQVLKEPHEKPSTQDVFVMAADLCAALCPTMARSYSPSPAAESRMAERGSYPPVCQDLRVANACLGFVNTLCTDAEDLGRLGPRRMLPE